MREGNQVVLMSGVGVLQARSRLRLVLGMRLLERLSQARSPVGQRIPSIRAVAAASRTHRNTVAKVYSDLARLGLIRCEAGSGSFVSHPRACLPRPDSEGIRCQEPELARLLSAEFRRMSGPDSPRYGTLDAGLPLLHPLDLAPPVDSLAFPLAPVGETLARLRSMRSGSTALVVSASPSVRRLMRGAIRAVHGLTVGIVSLEPDSATTDLISRHMGDVPTLLFHDPDWSPGFCGMASCTLRLLSQSSFNP